MVVWPVIITPLPPTPATPAQIASTPPETILPVYDSTNVAALPPGGVYLAYIDGRYKTLALLQARFPDSRIWTITTTCRIPADICDEEPGDASPATAANWVKAGDGHIVYSDKSDKPKLDADLTGTIWQWFAADPTGVPHQLSASIATQYAWPGRGSPGWFDISMSSFLGQAISTTSPPPASTLSPLP